MSAVCIGSGGRATAHRPRVEASRGPYKSSPFAWFAKKGGGDVSRTTTPENLHVLASAPAASIAGCSCSPSARSSSRERSATAKGPRRGAPR
ncbi:MAG: hypothetical protein BGO98_00430 [Myxococcales bacterium 68-20]|nr:MAG: hypothetical protein BGO98_00430 [Myxococcales bacterium 68-20]